MNVQEIHAEVRSHWIAEEAPRMPWAVRLAGGVNWSILIVVLAAFGLSAAHTVSIFSVVSPGVAWLAPVMIELGLAYSALRAKVDALHQEKSSPVMRALVVLFVVAAFASNLAGGLTAAAESSGIRGLSGGDVWSQFGILPLNVQAGLVIAVIMSVIVPAVAIVGGEGVASLLFDARRGESDWIEQRWREVEREVLYRAVYARLNGDGLPAREAAKVAQSEVRAYLAPVDPGRALPARASTSYTQGEQPPTHTGTAIPAQASTSAYTSPSTPYTQGERVYGVPSTSEAIRHFMAAHPETASLSISELQARLDREGISASRTLVHRVAKGVRKG